MNRIKEIRTELGYTQKELADELGLSVSAVAMMETNKRQPSNKTLDKLSKLFNVSMDYIMCHTEVRQPIEIKYNNKDKNESKAIRILKKETAKLTDEQINILTDMARQLAKINKENNS